MIEHDRNPAAQQADYPVGEERDPDPPALEHGTGRDLTCNLRSLSLGQGVSVLVREAEETHET